MVTLGVVSVLSFEELLYRVTSLIRNRHPIAPYGRFMSRAL
jgi:hypothetical protein